ncbi:MAG TPA: DMT family transporter [Candidatus Limnocylindria bacterium]|nr:DMT family transporter [Candidatus Limnocylindria bacterium]
MTRDRTAITTVGVRLSVGDVAILAASATYGVSTTVSVAALHSVRPADLLAVELVGSAGLQLVAAAVTGRLRWRGCVPQLLLGALSPGLTFLLGDLGLARTSASSGSLLLAVEPLLSAVLAVVILRERLGGRASLALAVGFAGSTLVALGPSTPGEASDSAFGNVLVLAAVLASAIFVIAVSHYSRALGGRHHPDAETVFDGLNASAWQTTGGMLAVVPFVAGSWIGGGSRLGAAGPVAWTACIGVLVCGAVAGVAFNRGIARVSAARAGLLANLTPAVGMATAVVFLRERPAPLQLAGGLLILAGLVLLLRTSPDSTDAPPPDLVPKQ